MFPGDRADVVAVCIDNAAHRIELPLDLGILHPVGQGLRLAVDRDRLDGRGFAAEPVEHRKSPSCPADQARTRSGSLEGSERHQARRRSGKGVASVALIAAMTSTWPVTKSETCDFGPKT